ncbi:MAG TPA: phage holin family protein [Nocardioides sp.]|jgi:membrane protein implicated in regulation of membrane protease activity|uniref:phage holin family protein n=1 Tax=Nocardioides sp. TaxID=35761 RepID=UPI002E32532B|nr:phage holin family protein [Nocardioides sp.]HEX3932408.1 phage holin family protein [Nocardioides sp.]
MAHEPVTDSDPTIGRLVSDASRDVSSLIRNEIRLAKSEIQLSVKAGGIGIALFAAAGFFALMSLIMLSVAIAYFINWNGHGLSLHWAFLIVFGFYLLLAALLAFIGIRSVKKVRAPEKAIAQANETKQILKRG